MVDMVKPSITFVNDSAKILNFCNILSTCPVYMNQWKCVICSPINQCVVTLLNIKF